MNSDVRFHKRIQTGAIFIGDKQKLALRVIMSFYSANDNDHFKAVSNDATVMFTLHALEN